MHAKSFAFIAAALLSTGATITSSAFAAPPRASHAYQPSVDEARYMRGTYQLADGRVLQVTSERQHVYATIDGRVEELVPVGERTFVTRNSEDRVVFDQLPFPNEIAVESAPANRVLASNAASAAAQPSEAPNRPAW